MLRNKSTIAVPPGATIAECIDDVDMTPEELAIQINISENDVADLINGRIPLTADTAIRLEEVFGIPAHFWINLETIYRNNLRRIASSTSADAAEALRLLYSDSATSVRTM